MKGAVLLAPLVLLIGGSAQPSVTVRSVSPFTVHGAHFVAAERVTVTVALHGLHFRRITANASGAFLARFPGLTAGRCDGWFVSARDNRRSRASLRLMPMCAP